MNKSSNCGKIDKDSSTEILLNYYEAAKPILSTQYFITQFSFQTTSQNWENELNIRALEKELLCLPTRYYIHVCLGI